MENLKEYLKSCASCASKDIDAQTEIRDLFVHEIVQDYDILEDYQKEYLKSYFLDEIEKLN